MIDQQPKEQAQYRDHWLRNVQAHLQAYAGPGIYLMGYLGLLDGTAIQRFLSQNQGHPEPWTLMNPDDVTLTGVQLSLRASKAILYGSGIVETGRDYLLGMLMDAGDGMVAREYSRTSPLGAVKDATTDRIVEMGVAELVYWRRAQFTGSDVDEENYRFLKIAFNLSMVTKALAQMTDTKTSEVGKGGFLNRRTRLFQLLWDLRWAEYPDYLQAADQITYRLVQDSEVSASARLRSVKSSIGQNPMKFLEGLTPGSVEAGEAMKYIWAVNALREIGFDIVDWGNRSGMGGLMPEPGWLMQAMPHLQNSIRELIPFTNQAKMIVAAELADIYSQ